ncbi:unnamed protein product [Closterium sp. NIES-54]
MADPQDEQDCSGDQGDDAHSRSPVDVSAAVTGLDLLFSSFAEVENHEKAAAATPPDFIHFEPTDEGLCASPTAPVLEQDSSSPSVEETAAVPVAKKNARYTQSTPPWCKMGGNAGATSPSPADQWSMLATAGMQLSPSVPGPSKPASPDAIYAEALHKYKSEWLDRLSWLILLKTSDGLLSFKCSICTEHAGYAGSCRRGGKGAADVQAQAFKRHAATTKHKEAFKHHEKLLSEAARQPRINGANLARDTEKERVIKLLDSLIFVTKQDAPIEEALAAKDAAEALPEFEMVDSLLRQVAEHLGRSGSWHQRFMSLQEVFTAPNLELQGIHQVWWLSRGDAFLRAVEVFPALIVMLYEWDSTLYELATSYRFHFLMYFLADVLEQLNVLNRAFQQREAQETDYIIPGIPIAYIDAVHEQGSLKDAPLEDLLMMSLLENEPDYDEVLEIWRSYKKRCPFGDVAATPAREGEGSGNGKGREADEEAGEELEQPEANCSDDD